VVQRDRNGRPGSAGGRFARVTRAQAVFVTALSVIAVLIGAFAVYVASSTMWADRWYGRRSRRR